MLLRNMCHYLVGWKIGYCCRKHDQKDATKRQGYIDPHSLIRTRDFIIVMGFKGSIQRKGLDSWNIKIICHNVSVDYCVCIPSNFYCTCWTRFVLVFFLLHWSPSCIVFVDCLNECDDIPLRQIIFTDHLHSYNRLLKIGMIWCTLPPHCLLNKLTSITNKP